MIQTASPPLLVRIPFVGLVQTCRWSWLIAFLMRVSIFFRPRTSCSCGRILCCRSLSVRKKEWMNEWLVSLPLLRLNDSCSYAEQRIDRPNGSCRVSRSFDWTALHDDDVVSSSRIFIVSQLFVSRLFVSRDRSSERLCLSCLQVVPSSRWLRLFVSSSRCYNRDASCRLQLLLVPGLRLPPPWLLKRGLLTRV